MQGENESWGREFKKRIGRLQERTKQKNCMGMAASDAKHIVLATIDDLGRNSNVCRCGRSLDAALAVLVAAEDEQVAAVTA